MGSVGAFRSLPWNGRPPSFCCSCSSETASSFANLLERSYGMIFDLSKSEEVHCSKDRVAR